MSDEIMSLQKKFKDCGIFILQTGPHLMSIGTIGSNLMCKHEHIDFYHYLIGATLMNPKKYASESITSSDKANLTVKECTNCGIPKIGAVSQDCT